MLDQRLTVFGKFERISVISNQCLLGKEESLDTLCCDGTKRHTKHRKQRQKIQVFISLSRGIINF